MSAVSGARDVASPRATDRRRPGRGCDGLIPARVGGHASCDPKSNASLPPPWNLVHASDHADCILSPESEKHADRFANGVDVRRGVPVGPAGFGEDPAHDAISLGFG